jgi:hypothetical protein
MLKAYQLRPWEVARLDPDFVQELLAAAQAESSPAYQKWLEQQRKRASKAGNRG